MAPFTRDFTDPKVGEPFPKVDPLRIPVKIGETNGQWRS